MFIETGPKILRFNCLMCGYVPWVLAETSRGIGSSGACSAGRCVPPRVVLGTALSSPGRRACAPESCLWPLSFPHSVWCCALTRLISCSGKMSFVFMWKICEEYCFWKFLCKTLNNYRLLYHKVEPTHTA